MLNRDKIISEAIDKCLEEMFQKSQPKGSYFEYIEKLNNGQIQKDEKVFERHYLNHTQFNYIRNKYKKAYRLQNEWKSNIDFLIQNLKEGGFKDVYKKHSDGTDYRTAEKMPPINKFIGKKNTEQLFDYINTIKDFYRFDHEEQIFDFNVCLGCSPTSNPETVKEYWKSKGVDIEIDTTELSEDDYWELDEFGEILKEEEDE